MNMNMVAVGAGDKNYHGFRLFASDLRKRLSHQGWSETSMIQHVGAMWGNLTEAQKFSWSESARMMAYEHLQRTFPDNLYMSRPGNANSLSNTHAVTNMGMGGHSSNFTSQMSTGYRGMQQGMASSSWPSQPGLALQRAMQTQQQSGTMPEQQTAGARFTMPSGGPQGLQRSPQSQSGGPQRSPQPHANQNALVPFSMPSQPMVQPQISPVQGRMQMFTNGLYQQTQGSTGQQENIPSFGQQSPRGLTQQPQRYPAITSGMNHVVPYGGRFPAPGGLQHNALMSCRQPLQQIPLNNSMNTRLSHHQRMLLPAQQNYAPVNSQHTSSNMQGYNVAPQKPTLKMSDVFDESPAPPGQAFKKIVIEVNGVRKTILVPTANHEASPVSETPTRGSKPTSSTQADFTPTATMSRQPAFTSTALQTQSSTVSNRNLHSVHPQIQSRQNIETQMFPRGFNVRETSIHGNVPIATGARTTNTVCNIAPMLDTQPTHGNKDSQPKTPVQDDYSLPDKNGDVSRLTSGMSNQVRELLKGIFDNYKDSNADQGSRSSTNLPQTSSSQHILITDAPVVQCVQNGNTREREASTLPNKSSTNLHTQVDVNKQITNSAPAASFPSSTSVVSSFHNTSTLSASGTLDICTPKPMGSNKDGNIVQSSDKTPRPMHNNNDCNVVQVSGKSHLQTQTAKPEKIKQNINESSSAKTANTFRHESVTISNEKDTGAIVLTIRNQEAKQEPISHRQSPPKTQSTAVCESGEKSRQSLKPLSPPLMRGGSSSELCRNDAVELPTFPVVCNQADQSLRESVRDIETEQSLPALSIDCTIRDDEYKPIETSSQSDDSDEEVTYRRQKRKRASSRLKKTRKFRRILTMKERRKSRRILESETSDTQNDSDFDWHDSSSSTSSDDDMCSTRKSPRAAAQAAKSAIGQLISLETAISPSKEGIRTRRDKYECWGYEKVRHSFDEEKAKVAFNVRDCRVVLRQLGIEER